MTYLKLQACHLSQVKRNGKIHQIHGVSPAKSHRGRQAQKQARHNCSMRITIVTGADGAPFVHELAAMLEASDELTVIAPTVRGHLAAGLQASPDLDGLLSPTTTPTYAVADALDSVQFTPRWQRASDQSTAARLVRTQLLATGAALTDATLAAAMRASLPYRLLPMCDGRAEFRVVIGTDDPRAIHIDEYLADPSSHEPTQLLLVADGISTSSDGLPGTRRHRRAGARPVEPDAGDRPRAAHTRIPRRDQGRPARARRRARGHRTG